MYQEVEIQRLITDINKIDQLADTLTVYNSFNKDANVNTAIKELLKQLSNKKDALKQTVDSLINEEVSIAKACAYTMQ